MDVEKWDRRFLAHAEFVSQWSRDPSTKVGAVITREKVIVSSGYNGFPRSMPDRVESYVNRDEKLSRIIHGEVNALIFSQQSVEGCTLTTFPFSPCDRCSVILLQAGIKRFVFPALPADKVERWGKSMETAKQYITECGATWTEYQPVVQGVQG